ncbi:hypothetical protein L7F22_030895 [Adiantum nelumboides]|nr:hypothetical protein [Adiantum nelumboides]
MGYFNGRTQSRQCEIYDMEQLEIMKTLDAEDMGVSRVSADEGQDNTGYGRHLLDLGSRHHLVIYNGMARWSMGKDNCLHREMPEQTTVQLNMEVGFENSRVVAIRNLSTTLRDPFRVLCTFGILSRCRFLGIGLDRSNLIPQFDKNESSTSVESVHLLFLKNFPDPQVAIEARPRRYVSGFEEDRQNAPNQLEPKTELTANLCNLKILDSLKGDCSFPGIPLTYFPKCPGGLSDPLVSTIGVKQGCPLSPTLFGLYIDEIVDFIQRSGGDGVELGGTTVHILLYADDIVLVSESAEGLQQHLRGLDDFCSQRGMTVNLGKTKVLIFHTSARVRRQSSFTAAGGDIEITGSYVYLGVTFTAASGAFSMTQAARDRLTRGYSAHSQMERECHQAHFQEPRTKGWLFDTLVTPALMYEAAIWGPGLTDATWTLIERPQVLMISRLIRSKASVPHNIVRAELAAPPMVVEALFQTGRQTHEVGESSRPPRTDDEIFRTQLVTVVTMFTQVMQNPRFLAFLQLPLPSQQVGSLDHIQKRVTAQAHVIHTAESMETPVHLTETMQSPKPMPNAQEQRAETPVFQAVPVQPAPFQQLIAGSNGQASNLEAMQEVFPPPSVHPGYFGGGSVSQSMAGPALGNQSYMPRTVFKGAQTMLPNPMRNRGRLQCFQEGGMSQNDDLAVLTQIKSKEEVSNGPRKAYFEELYSYSDIFTMKGGSSGQNTPCFVIVARARQTWIHCFIWRDSGHDGVCLTKIQGQEEGDRRQATCGKVD